MARILTAVAWPYANGPRHIGHVSGFGVPSDIFSRYERMVGNDVLTEIVQELVARSSLITMLYQSVRDAACSSDEHIAFLKAARTGDSQSAVASISAARPLVVIGSSPLGSGAAGPAAPLS